MFASIQSERFNEFYCHIKEDPVLAFRNFLVYELTESSVPNDIIKKINGKHAGTYRHVALDTNGIGYLFDFYNKKIESSVGPCKYLSDIRP